MKWTHALLIGLFTNLSLTAQDLDSYHQSLVDQVQKDNIINDLLAFESLGVKTLGSDEEQNTFNWIKSYYQDWNYTDIQEQTISAYGETGKNLIVTKTGTHYPDQFIVICAHFDSIYGPGVNDNGSGTSILLEIARILREVSTEYSIKFIHFTGEEWGLHGSSQYVDYIAIPGDLDIKLVFNIDQVGGVAGEVNDSVTCEYDLSWPEFNNAASMTATMELATCIELYSNLNADYSYAYSSDYMPFQDEGFVITGLYESNESPYPHTAMDTFENVDTEFIYQVGKGALGALCYFAKAYENLDVTDENWAQLQIYPNPVSKQLNIQTKSDLEIRYQLIDLSGKVVKTGKFIGNLHQIDVQDLAQGVYFLKLTAGQHIENHKIIVQSN